jgi:hypothetical protein
MSQFPEFQNLPINTVFITEGGITLDAEAISEQAESWICPVTDRTIKFVGFLRELTHRKRTFVVTKKEDGYEAYTQLGRWATGERPSPVVMRYKDIEKLIDEAGYTLIDAKGVPNNPRCAVVTYTDRGVTKHARLPLYGDDLRRRRRTTLKKRRDCYFS